MKNKELQQKIKQSKKVAYNIGKSLIISGAVSLISNPNNYKKIGKYIADKNCYTVISRSDLPFMYSKLIYWLNKNFGEKIGQYLYLENKTYKSLGELSDIISNKIQLKYGEYKFYYKNCFIIVNSSNYNNINIEESTIIIEQIQISIYGIKRYTDILKNEIEDLLNQDIDLDNTTMIRTMVDYNIFTSWSPKRDFNSIFSDQKENIIKYLDIWKYNKEFYANHSLPFKMCLLLYGKPGTGKTSIVKAIANHLNLHINYINLGSINLDKLNSISAMNDSIILLEEIDLSTNKSSTSKDSTNPEQIISVLLNILDGINSPENCIFIATTNYPENIDKRLMRPGRFNNGIEIKNICRKTAEDLCIYLESDPLEVLTDDMILEDNLYNPAQIQQKVLEKLNILEDK